MGEGQVSLLRLLTSNLYLCCLVVLTFALSVVVFLPYPAKGWIRYASLARWQGSSGLSYRTADELIRGIVSGVESNNLGIFSGPITDLAKAEEFWERGDKAAARTIWNNLLQADNYYATLALVAARSEITPTARRYAAIVLALSDPAKPGMAAEYSSLCYAFRAFPEEAIPWCAKYVLSVPDGWSHYRLAKLYVEMGDNEQALKVLKDGLAAGNMAATPTLYFESGEIYRTLQTWRESAFAYLAAIESGYPEPLVYRRLAFVLAELGDMQQACEYYIISVAKGIQDTPGSKQIFGACAASGVQ